MDLKTNKDDDINNKRDKHENIPDFSSKSVLFKTWKIEPNDDKIIRNPTAIDNILKSKTLDFHWLPYTNNINSEELKNKNTDKGKPIIDNKEINFLKSAKTLLVLLYFDSTGKNTGVITWVRLWTGINISLYDLS